MLDTHKGEALLAVIDSGSFEQAAKWLHLTPSAVSQRISALESQLGTPLLIRSRPCRATRAGQRLLQYLRRSQLLEHEFLAELEHEQQHFLPVTMVVNHDTLATWLLPALSQFLQAEQLLLDISLDDQDHTYTLLESGQALVGISSESEALRGCRAQALGIMRYRLLAHPDFAARYFPQGLQREAARRAPLMVFNRKDALQSNFLLRTLGLPSTHLNCHYVPSSEAFLQAIELGLGYGMVPEIQYQPTTGLRPLIDLAPSQATDITLYWHCWQVQSPKLERLSQAVIQAAKQALLPLPSERL
ncbi:LysR family transcriptional regulator ArgP [uncultured Deefgea sp.]|uniref:LysR family transcriptional regulator ArgP n=1 Tax=uncultured Deefgea sp. TaxID=1304914 RepID=UPI002598E840|nr:LysR family transcriptional regulator ArgP [uncultured Deefgea sp.]